MLRKHRWVLFVFFFATSSAQAEVLKDPDCDGVESWATNMAASKLKNAGITDNNEIDFSKTKTVRLVSEKIGKDTYYHHDLYRQVHNITFMEKSGNVIEVITISDATDVECSMGEVDVFVVSKHL